MRKMTIGETAKNDAITYGMVIVAFIAVQILLVAGHMSSLMKGLLVSLCIYIIMAVSLNLTVDILRELSPGHAGFICIDAFASSFSFVCMEDTVTNTGLRFFLTLLIGAAATAMTGIIVGIPVLRLRGDYLATVTLAFGKIIKNVVDVIYLDRDSAGFHMSMKNSVELNMLKDGKVIVNGAQGITGTPNSSIFVIGSVLILITLFIVPNLIHSGSGRVIMAIRGNRIAAESIGINITRYKPVALTISASLAGVAGVLHSHNLSTLAAAQKNFGYNQSIMILTLMVLGGISNIRGSVIAAVILTLLPGLLHGLSNYRMLIYAIVLIAVMIFS